MALEGNTPDGRERPGIDELYSVSTGSSNLRVGNDSNIRTPGDLTAAAGMNRHRMGLTLNRLFSEWNRGAAPKPQPLPGVKHLAQITAESRWKKAPFVCLPIVHIEDVETAEAEARRRTAESADWQMQEHQLRFLRLKSLPAVRAGLLHHARSKGWEGAEHLVAAVIQRFLSPVCPVCEGRKFRVIAGTGRTGSKACSGCKGSGEAKIPHGGAGRSLLGYIRACIGTAMGDLREGSAAVKRSAANIDRRTEQAAADKSDMDKRAVTEAAADSRQDTAAVREHFRITLGKRMKRGG